MVSRQYGAAVHLVWPEDPGDIGFYTRVGCGLFARNVEDRVTNDLMEVTCKKCVVSQRMLLARL